MWFVWNNYSYVWVVIIIDVVVGPDEGCICFRWPKGIYLIWRMCWPLLSDHRNIHQGVYCLWLGWNFHVSKINLAVVQTFIILAVVTVFCLNKILTGIWNPSHCSHTAIVHLACNKTAAVFSVLNTVFQISNQLNQHCAARKDLCLRHSNWRTATQDIFGLK